MPPDLAVEEYRALRATIRERGTARQFVSVLTFLAWAPCTIWLTSAVVAPATTLVALVVLAAGFEVVYGAHVGVERIGRYLQTRYELSAGDLPAWERTALRFGREPQAATGSDPLLTRIFALATLLNLLPVASSQTTSLAGWEVVQTVLVVGIHGAFLLRLSQGQRFARSQRERDQEMFEQIARE